MFNEKYSNRDRELLNSIKLNRTKMLRSITVAMVVLDNFWEL